MAENPFANQRDVQKYLERLLKANPELTDTLRISQVRESTSGLGGGVLRLDLSDGSKLTIEFERKSRNG